MRRKRNNSAGLRTAVLIAAGIVSIGPVFGFATFGDVETWPDGNIVLQLQLQSGGPAGADWNQTAADAGADWNRHMVDTRFTSVRDSTAAKGAQNRFNNVFWADNIYGETLDKYTLGITAGWEAAGDASTITEADVVFNPAAGPWAVYRGRLRANGTADFRRVAIHEFGHILGLDHPDEQGQSVAALMNSIISDTDDLVTDDIDGATYLYGPKVPVIVQQPKNLTTSSSILDGTLKAKISGRGPLSVTWRKDGDDYQGIIPLTVFGYPSASVDVSRERPATYDLVVANRYGLATSAPARVVEKHGLSAPLADQAVNPGAKATFQAAIAGTGKATCHWYFRPVDNAPETLIDGATGPTLVIGKTRVADLGIYRIEVRVDGRTTSSSAALTFKVGGIVRESQDVVAGQTVNLSAELFGQSYFNHIDDVMLDAAGNLYVADESLRKISPKAAVSTFSSSVYSTLVRNGNEIVALNPMGQVYRVCPDGTGLLLVPAFSGYADGWVSSAAFGRITGLAPGSGGDLFLADSGNGVIRRVSSKSLVTTFAGQAKSHVRRDGKGTAAGFENLGRMIAGPGGVLYVADRSANYAVIRRIATDGTVSTLAGGAVSPGRQLDGKGKAAAFVKADALAIDAAGRLYVADAGTVRRVTAAGNVTTLAGMAGKYGYVEGTGATARFSQTLSLAVSAGGTVYVGDGGNRVVRRITSAGSVSTFAGTRLIGTHGKEDGSQTTLQWRFNGKDIAGATQSSLTLKNFRTANVGSYTVVVKNLSGQTTAEPAYVGFPPVISRQPAGALVAEGGETTLHVVAASLDGRPLTYQWMKDTWPLQGATGPDLTLTNFDRSKSGNYSVRIFDGAGYVESEMAYVNFGLLLDQKPASGTFADGADTLLSVLSTSLCEPSFGEPLGLAIDAAGNVYVADRGYHALRRISRDGTVTTIAGNRGAAEADGTGNAAAFAQPAAVACDAAGNVYVADSGGATIRKVTPAGVVSTVAGKAFTPGAVDGSGGAARFRTPSGLALDSAGNLFVADRDNHTVRKITPDGKVSTLAGAAGQAGYADGRGAAARFNAPAGIAVDAADRVWISDANNVLRRIDPDGTVGTIAGKAGAAGHTDGTGGAARFGAPGALAVGPDGAIYWAESDANQIRRIAADGSVTSLVTAWSSWVGGNFRGLVFDGGAWLATEGDRNQIDRIGADGAASVFAAGRSARNSIDGSLTRYQWKFNGAIIPGATGASLALNDIQEAAAGTYTVVLSNIYGSTTATATVTRVPSAPRVDDFDLSTRNRAEGESCTFAVAAAGTEPLSYQWLKDGAPIPGATGATFSLSSVRPADAGDYAVLILGPAGQVTTGWAALNVGNPAAPVITSAPRPAHVASGYAVTLQVAASNASHYQWRRDGIDVPGATGSTLAFPHAVGTDSGVYAVVVTGSGGRTVSPAARVVVDPAGAPRISSVDSWTGPPGRTVVFNPTVETDGSRTTYQWRKDGVPVAGATSTRLTLKQVGPGAQGTYQLAVTNDAGTFLSNPAALTLATRVWFGSMWWTSNVAAGSSAVIHFDVLSDTFEGNKLKVLAVAIDPTQFPGGTYVLGGHGTERTITLRPPATAGGLTAIRLTVTDGITSASQDLSVNIIARNHPPAITPIASVTIGTHNLATASFDVSDPDITDDVFPQQYLSLTFASSNPELVDAGRIKVTVGDDPGPGSKTIQITPDLVKTGRATITVTVSDGQASASTKFVVAIAEANHAPTISAIASRTINEDTRTTVSFKIADIETPASALALTATSSSSKVVPPAGLTFSGSGANRKLTITPAPNASGKSTLTIRVSDGAKSANRKFALTVKAVNDAPTLDPIANQIVKENDTAGGIRLHVADVDNAVSSLKLSVAASDASLLPVSGLILGGSGANRTLLVRPATGRSGTTKVKVTVSDGKLSVNRTFTLKVTPAPRAPTLAAIADQTLNENQTGTAIACTVGDADTPLANLVLSATSSNASLLPATGFTFAGSGANRTLRITPTRAGHGSATVTVTVSDGVLTANRSFKVAVRPLATITSASAARQVLSAGQSLWLSVGVQATGTAHCQWFHNGHAIAGTDATSYGRSAVTATDAGVYWVEVTDAVGLSRSAPFFVFTPPPQTTVRAWGSAAAGLTTVPGSLNRVVALAAGPAHVLTVKADGAVAAWGSNSAGQCSVPTGLTNVVAVAAGTDHSLALRADGVVVAWGSAAAGAKTVPAGLSGVIAIAAGDGFSLAAKIDGTVVKWGSGGADLPETLTGVVAVAACGRQALALRADGTLVAWGANVAAQLIPPAAARSSVQALAVGATHSLVLRTDGTVVAWGDNSCGQVTVPASLAEVTGVAAGGRHSLAMCADGSVVAWGDNAAGQSMVPADLDLAEGVTAGDAASLVVTDTTPFAALAFATDPSDATVTAGSEAEFSVSVTGYPVPLYRWQVSTDAGATWTDLVENVTCEGTRSSVLTLVTTTVDQDGYRYRCVVDNAVQTEVASAAAVLHVQAATP